MKKYWSLICIVLIACHHDDDDTIRPDFFEYDGESRQVFSAAALRYMEDAGQYQVELSLTGPGISYDDQSDSFTGTGDRVKLNLTLQEPKLVEGLYELSTAGKLTAGDVYILYNMETDQPASGGFSNALKKGNITVTINLGDEYVIRFDFVDEADKALSGKYTGTIENYNVTPPPDFFEYDGQSFPAFVMAAQRVVKEEKNYDVDVILLSPGITYDQGKGTFSGVGNIVRFDFTLSEGNPIAGEYRIDANEKEPETLYLSMVGIKLDTSTGLPEEGGIFHLISKGSLVLQVLENEYVFEFDMVDPLGKSVKGGYQGTIEIDLK